MVWINGQLTVGSDGLTFSHHAGPVLFDSS